MIVALPGLTFSVIDKMLKILQDDTKCHKKKKKKKKKKKRQ